MRMLREFGEVSFASACDVSSVVLCHVLCCLCDMTCYESELCSVAEPVTHVLRSAPLIPSTQLHLAKANTSCDGLFKTTIPLIMAAPSMLRIAATPISDEGERVSVFVLAVQAVVRSRGLPLFCPAAATSSFCSAGTSG